MTRFVETASAIIFDLEGIILDTEITWDRAQEVLLSRRGRRYDRAALKHRITGLGAGAAISVVIDHYQLPDDPEDLLRERRDIMLELLGNRVAYVPGAVEYVRAAADAVRVCVATSMDPGMFDAVAAGSGLTSFFPGPVFTPTHVGGVTKPEPDLFLHAAAELGVESAGCVVIEDSPIGIRAARAAGMPCVALCTTHERHQLNGADVVFGHWGEVPLPTSLGRNTATSRTTTGTCPISK